MRRRPCLALMIAAPFFLPGCFDERSFPMRESTIITAGGLDPAAPAGVCTTRSWLTRTQPQLAPLLTRRGQKVLLTQDLVKPDGQPVDVYAALEKNPANLNNFRRNFYGILHTGQASARNYYIEEKAPDWPGFEDIWIPVAPGLELSGRLGLARSDSGIMTSDCLILLPGLWGDIGVVRTRDLAIGLREQGHHVLALEVRGHGQTEHRYPNVYYNFGVIETQDLLDVSEWLEDTWPEIRGTGLLGFCWGSNLALLGAWYDGRKPDDPSISPRLAAILDPPTSRRHFTSGVLAFSPVLRWEEVMERADIEHGMEQPVTYFFQQSMRERMVRKAHSQVNGSLRHLINYEYQRSELSAALPLGEAYSMLRLLEHRGKPAGDKLEHARVPVLLVTSVNDPFLSAQDLADLTAVTDNPLVASMVMRGGGHVGFAPYNPSYFYSLIVSFFDPRTGAAACVRQQAGARTEASPSAAHRQD